MVIQAQAAELLLEHDGLAADQAMAAVEQTGRHALSDMRHLLGVLRHPDAPAPRAPQPGVGQVYALVEEGRTSGRTIELIVEGDPGPLSTSIDLAVYRILEEALDGSRPDTTHIHLRFTDTSIELDVRAPGRHDAGLWPTLAMRERAALCRGSIGTSTIEGSRRLTVSLPRRAEEVLA
jgi:signal transduction histidine kinase